MIIFLNNILRCHSYSFFIKFSINLIVFFCLICFLNTRLIDSVNQIVVETGVDGGVNSGTPIFNIRLIELVLTFSSRED